MFYYVTFTAYRAASASQIFDHALFSISSEIQEPLSRMLKAFRQRSENSFSNVRFVMCRVITPDDYQEFLKMGVPPFHIEKEK